MTNVHRSGHLSANKASGITAWSQWNCGSSQKEKKYATRLGSASTAIRTSFMPIRLFNLSWWRPTPIDFKTFGRQQSFSLRSDCKQDVRHWVLPERDEVFGLKALNMSSCTLVEYSD